MGFPTLLLLLKSLLESTINLTLCTPSEPLSIGTLVKVWKKVSFPKLVKIWLHWRKIMKKSVLILWKKEMKVMINSSLFLDLAIFILLILLLEDNAPRPNLQQNSIFGNGSIPMIKYQSLSIVF